MTAPEQQAASKVDIVNLGEPDLRQRIAEELTVWSEHHGLRRTPTVVANAYSRADAVLAGVSDDLAARDAENTRLREQVQAARDFADEMADYCSPHGVAALYAQRLTERLDAASAPSI